METVDLLVEGGKASPGPPLGPKLGPLGVNIKEIVDSINEATRDFDGMQVPVTLEIDTETKEYEITVGTPPTAALIIKRAGIKQGSGVPQENFVGDISVEDARAIADMKRNDMLGKSTKSRVKEVIGTCVSMGVTFEGADPREAVETVGSGAYDDELQEQG